MFWTAGYNIRHLICKALATLCIVYQTSNILMGFVGLEKHGLADVLSTYSERLFKQNGGLIGTLRGDSRIFILGGLSPQWGYNNKK